MTEPTATTDRSVRFSLPFVHPGQAQKEFFINEIAVRSDFLLHPAVVGESAVPPAQPVAGELWLIADGASGPWLDRQGQLAGWQGGSWHYITPTPGMRVYDAAAGLFLTYKDGWQRLSAPPAVANGATVDTELRTAFAALVGTLVAAGILAAP